MTLIIILKIICIFSMGVDFIINKVSQKHLNSGLIKHLWNLLRMKFSSLKVWKSVNTLADVHTRWMRRYSLSITQIMMKDYTQAVGSLTYLTINRWCWLSLMIPCAKKVCSIVLLNPSLEVISFPLIHIISISNLKIHPRMVTRKYLVNTFSYLAEDLRLQLVNHLEAT
jgi:hypothetical protein